MAQEVVQHATAARVHSTGYLRMGMLADPPWHVIRIPQMAEVVRSVGWPLVAPEREEEATLWRSLLPISAWILQIPGEERTSVEAMVDAEMMSEERPDACAPSTMSSSVLPYRVSGLQVHAHSVAGCQCLADSARCYKWLPADL